MLGYYIHLASPKLSCWQSVLRSKKTAVLSVVKKYHIPIALGKQTLGLPYWQQQFKKIKIRLQIKLALKIP